MRVTVPALVLTFAVPAVAMAQGTADPAVLTSLPLISDIAPTAVAISPHVPQMGAHYADPATLPTGPIWCVIEGHVVCVEYMFPAEALAAGQSWRGLPTGNLPAPITHVDLDFMPNGVGPMQVPLYQLHIWFADQTLLAQH